MHRLLTWTLATVALLNMLGIGAACPETVNINNETVVLRDRCLEGHDLLEIKYAEDQGNVYDGIQIRRGARYEKKNAYLVEHHRNMIMRYLNRNETDLASLAIVNYYAGITNFTDEQSIESMTEIVREQFNTIECCDWDLQMTEVVTFPLCLCDLKSDGWRARFDNDRQRVMNKHNYPLALIFLTMVRTSSDLDLQDEVAKMFERKGTEPENVERPKSFEEKLMDLINKWTTKVVDWFKSLSVSRGSELDLSSNENGATNSTVAEVLYNCTTQITPNAAETFVSNATVFEFTTAYLEMLSYLNRKQELIMADAIRMKELFNKRFHANLYPKLETASASDNTRSLKLIAFFALICLYLF